MPQRKKSSDRGVSYDAVTVHFANDEEPLRIERVQALVESRFPGSGERALQIIDDPLEPVPAAGIEDRKEVLTAHMPGLSKIELILVSPKEIDHLVLEDGGEIRKVQVEEIL